jgi:general secretion pathway protein M
MKALIRGYRQLGSRDQRILIIATPIVVVLLGYAAVWDPLAQSVAADRDRRDALREEVAGMRSAAREVEALRARRGGGEPARPGAEGSALILVDRTAKAVDLRDAIRRIQPDSGDSVRVTLSDARFETLMRWLVELRRQHGIRATNLTINAEDTPGLVQARVVLQRGAKGSGS